MEKKPDQFDINNKIIQGSVFGPIQCAIQVDTLGRDCYVEENGLYLYEGAVFIKPLAMILAMIDDIATAAECGANSLEINAKMNSKMYSKKLRLSEDKRKLLHVSKRSKKCDGALNAHGKEI